MFVIKRTVEDQVTFLGAGDPDGFAFFDTCTAPEVTRTTSKQFAHTLLDKAGQSIDVSNCEVLEV